MTIAVRTPPREELRLESVPRGYLLSVYAVEQDGAEHRKGGGFLLGRGDLERLQEAITNLLQ